MLSLPCGSQQFIQELHSFLLATNKFLIIIQVVFQHYLPKYIMPANFFFLLGYDLPFVLPQVFVEHL